MLDEPRVDALADLRLEDPPGLLLGHDDAIDQRAVDVDRVPADHRAVGQRERQRPLEHPPVRVAERQRLGRLGEHPGHDDRDVERLERHRLLAAGRRHERQHVVHPELATRAASRDLGHPSKLARPAARITWLRELLGWDRG